MSAPSPNAPPSPRSSSAQTPPVFTPMHHAPTMQRESIAGSPLVTTEGGRKGSVSIGGSGAGRRMSGVIPSPSGRRGSGSVVTPGGQVVAYHTRTNVSPRARGRGVHMASQVWGGTWVADESADRSGCGTGRTTLLTPTPRRVSVDSAMVERGTMAC